jgi:hypothetical protein
MGKGRGGRRPGAGRKPGSLTKKTREIAEQAAAEGITPLELQLATMRALWAEANAGDNLDLEKAERAAAIAKDAAPYVHPRLSAVEATVNVTDHEAALDELE